LTSLQRTSVSHRQRGSRYVAVCLAFLSLATLCQPQQLTPSERDEVQTMLRNIADEVKRHYYDPKMHGIDWDAKVRESKEKIDKADSLNRGLSQIAATLDSLNDSHTFFLPPPRPYRHDYGFRMQMIGDHCYVVRVRPGSDAETKGVKPGDEILAVNNFAPVREYFWKMEYVYNALRPQPALTLNLRTPNGEQRQILVNAKMQDLPPIRDVTGERMWDYIRDAETEQSYLHMRFAESGHDLLVVKFPEFGAFPSEEDSVLGKMRKYNSVVFDLRGNQGGSQDSLRALLGSLFEKKVKIGDRLGKSSTKLLETEARDHPFTGKLVVLVDSKSASASEMFARVVQIEKRGFVVGDRTAGAVMEAKHYNYQLGTSRVVFYGASITDADFRMADGESLEHSGVLPDKLILPAASDLASGRDPVLALAAQMLDVKMSPEEAGALLPYEWPKE
jgi:C-terminal processing protease CtpA/Prc